MGLSCLLLTTDAALLGVVQTTFGAAGISVEFRADTASAMDLSGRRHIDGFVLDLDDVNGGMQTVGAIRNSRSNKLSVIFAVLNGKTSVSAAVDAGANFVSDKPVRNGVLQAQLESALPKMTREHRRYFRHKVDLPITLSWTTGTVNGRLLNISESGLAFRYFGAASCEGTVTIQFELPGTTPQLFSAKAEVVWKDASATGLRFLRIEPGSQLSFEGWLKSLEARLQFRESYQSDMTAL